ncbi:unnamed protein product [Lota lota]
MGEPEPRAAWSSPASIEKTDLLRDSSPQTVGLIKAAFQRGHCGTSSPSAIKGRISRLVSESEERVHSED